MSARFDAIVIGGGANGLVAASRLARAGRRVVLIERGERLGGQGGIVEFAPGFRAAPLGLDPGWLPPTVARGLGLDGLERGAPDPGVSVALSSGGLLTLSRDPRRAADALRAHSSADAAAWPGFTARLQRLAGFLEALYQMPAPDIDARSPGELLSLLDLGRKFRALGSRDMIEFLRTLPLSVWELLDDEFESDALKAAVATGGVIDHPQGPRSGGTGFVLLHHLVGAPAGSVRRRLPWRGGAAAFTEAAERVARAAGVTVRAGAAVTSITIRDDAVAGVVLDGGEEIAGARVLSTADPARTILDWVDPVWLDPEIRHAVANVRHRGCTAIVLYALAELPSFTGLADAEALAGLVSLTPDLTTLERAADAVKYGTVPDRPHVELTVPTLADPTLAGAGTHVLVARAHYAPYHLRDGTTWDAARREGLADTVTSAIEAAAPCFRSRIVHRVAWSPRDLEERYGLREGAASQGELGLDQILFMRPIAGWGGHATSIRGLYLGGAGAHPGPGVLGGAGWLAAGRLLADAGRGGRNR